MRKFQNEQRDIDALPKVYQSFFYAIAKAIPDERIITDPVRNFAFGEDASLYRITPKIVVKARQTADVSLILKEAAKVHIPVTFRAAGTSLCGQALTDSVLVLITDDWQHYKIEDEGSRITLQPGVLGSHANLYLKKYWRKIGPDPASIKHALIGGIAANNASGMCCGTSDNSYKTVLDMKLVFADGSTLNTADPGDCEAWSAAHPEIIETLESIRDEVADDAELRELIAHKFKIKNTTGYSLNAFVDYKDPIDILKHVLIGSEGTLAMIAEITYRTVVEAKYKASAMLFFPSMRVACQAVHELYRPLVAAAEMLDRVSLRSVENWPEIPDYYKTFPDGVAAILTECRADTKEELQEKVEKVKEIMKGFELVRPIYFTDNPEEYNMYWQVRAGIFPAVGGVRELGTTVIIEDIAFQHDNLADAVMDLRELMDKHGYGDGIIYGHVLDGNVHFVIMQRFQTEEEEKHYQVFLEDVCHMVTDKYHGSLKAEHGTGRNMAPFVEQEWGKKAYSLMKRIKKAFDPQTILNPDVIITENGLVFMEHIKRMYPVHEIVDRCMECGYCEVDCPSRNLTFTPRQRTAIQREISRLRATGEDPARLKRFEDEYRYYGEETCAVDGLCMVNCPLSINTGDFTRQLRAAQAPDSLKNGAAFMADHFAGVSCLTRVGLDGLDLVHSIVGKGFIAWADRKLRAVSGGKFPYWTEWMPKGGHLPQLAAPTQQNTEKPKVVYFPSCTTRMMGVAKGDHDKRHLSYVMIQLLERAGYEVILPKDLKKYCCGMPFESMGLFKVADKLSDQLETALLAASKDGAYPILCDMSPCTYRMQHKMGDKLHIYDTVAFIHDFLLDKLSIHKVDRTIMVHVTCSAVKMGLTKQFREIAEKCATKVVIPEKVACCGFAGDKGFTNPELNDSALKHLKEAIPEGCSYGYSNSRTCEIGLSAKSGFSYQSIAYLVEECSRTSEA